jgi:hypothetical protein
LGVANEMEGGDTHLLSFCFLLRIEEEISPVRPRQWVDLIIVGGKLYLEVWWWPVIHHFVDWDRRLTGGWQVAIFASARVTRKMFTPISIPRIAKLCAGFC